MRLQKIINEKGDSVHAWYYEDGISVGLFDRENHVANCFASVGVYKNEKAVVINKELAEKMGFKIVFE